MKNRIVAAGIVLAFVAVAACSAAAAEPVVDELSSYLRVDPSTRGQAPADGKTACKITIFVRNANDRPVSGKKVEVITSRGPEVDLVKFIRGNTTDGEGICEIEIRSKQTGGTDIIALCEGTTITENIVNDGSFEQGEDEAPTTWAAAGASWLVQSEEKYRGKKALYYVKEGDGDHYADALWPDLEPQNFYPVSENTNFRISHFAKTNGATASVRPVWFRGEVASYDGYLTEGSYGMLKGKKDWKLQTVKVTSPPGAAFLMYRCNTSDSEGEAWFDCVRVQRVPTLDFVAK